MSSRKRRDWASTSASAVGSTINKKSALSAAYAELGKELTSGRLRSVGTYTLGRPIGEGTYGKVRLGTHRLTGTRVAIKQVPKAHSANLTREIHHHRRLHHPNVMQLYEVLATESYIWMVTELCAGGELYDYLVERGTMPEPEARRIFGQLCLAVAYVHDRGIVHRDLKLENVLLDERCNVKLGDFGFTREFEGKKLMETFCGTTGYAAPEMLAGRRYTGEEVDIWSLGVILYALVCGALPFDDDDEAVMKAKILHGNYDLPEFLSEECRDLISKILQQDPNARPSIKDVLAHPWCTKVMALVPMETVDEDVRDDETTDDLADKGISFLSAEHPKPVASPNQIDVRNDLTPEDLSHKASSSGLSETSFFSAKSKTDSESSDPQSSNTETTSPTTDGGDEDSHMLHIVKKDKLESEPLSLKHRNESQTTIKRQTSGGSDASRKASGPSSKPTSAPLPTHEEATAEPNTMEQNDAWTPTMPLSAPLEKRGSQSSSRGGHHRTPSRTKRRSSGGLSDHHPPSLDVRPIDYLALLEQSTPAIFSTVVEQNVLHQLSGLGMDVGQIVHSVVNEACDASGAMWWILKKKAEERAQEESEQGNPPYLSAYALAQPSSSALPIKDASRPRDDSLPSQTFAARTSPTMPHRDLIRPTAVKAANRETHQLDDVPGPDIAGIRPAAGVMIPLRDASSRTHEGTSTASLSRPTVSAGTSSAPNAATSVPASRPSRPGESRGRANSFGVRLSQVLAGKDKDKDKDARKDSIEATSVTIGNEQFALEERSKSPVVGGLFTKKSEKNSPSPSGTPKGDKKKEYRSPLRHESLASTAQTDDKHAKTPSGRSYTASPSESPTRTVQRASNTAEGNLKPTESFDTFSTISSSAHGDQTDSAGKTRSGKSSFLHTVRNWLGTEDKGKDGSSGTKKKRKKPNVHTGTVKRVPSIHTTRSASPAVTRNGSMRRMPPPSYPVGSVSRSPRLSQRGSISRRSSSGSVQYPAKPQRPISVRRPSAGSITPTATIPNDGEYMLPYRGSRPSSAQSLHRPPGSVSLHAKSGSTGSSHSFARMQSHGSGYSGSLRGIHARRPSVDGGTTVRRHRHYPHHHHSRSESESRSRPSTPSRTMAFDDGSMDLATPRRSLDSGRASPQQTPRASQSVFVAHRSRTPYKPPSANPSLLRSENMHEDRGMGHDGNSAGLGHSSARFYAHAPVFGTWRRSWGKPPPSWAGLVDQGPGNVTADEGDEGPSSSEKPKLRDVFASRESDDDWEDEDDEPTYAGGLGQLASSTWAADGIGASMANSAFGSGVGSASSRQEGVPSSLMATGRYAGIRGMFQSPSLGRETMPRTWIATNDESKNGEMNREAQSSSPIVPLSTLGAPTSSAITAEQTKDGPAPTPVPPPNTGSRVRSAAPTFKGPVTIEEEEEDE